MRLLAELARGALDLVFAPVCVACRAPLSTAGDERRVCAVCWSRARPVPVPRCPRCWSPVLPPPVPDVPPRCTLCPTLPPYLRIVRSAFVLEGPARELVHALKYEGWSALAEPMARRMAALPLLPDVREEVRMVVPVPLSAARRRERGYNQAALLAVGIAACHGWESHAELLLRSHATGSQTALHPAQRRANVAGAFRPRDHDPASLRGEHVLLVDDVWTTGATALACADALVAAGARVVSVVTFARALPELRRLRGEP